MNEIGFDVCTSCQLLTVDELVQPTFDCDSRFISSGIYIHAMTQIFSLFMLIT